MQSAPVVQPLTPSTLPVASPANVSPAFLDQSTAVQLSAEHAAQPVIPGCGTRATTGAPVSAMAEVPSGLSALRAATSQPVQPEAQHTAQLVQPHCAMRPSVPVTATAAFLPVQPSDVAQEMPANLPPNLLGSETEQDVVEDTAKEASGDETPRRRR